MSAALFAHGEHETEAAAQAEAAGLTGSVVRFDKIRQRWDVLAPSADDGCKVIPFRRLTEIAPPVDDADPHESKLRRIAELKNCDIEDVRRWEREVQDNARAYVAQMLNDSEKLREELAAGRIQATVAAAEPEGDDWLNTSRFRIIEAGEFAGGAYVEPDWLIEDVLPARGLALAWGNSGSHKTGGIFDMATACHRGVPWRDKSVKRGRSVIVVAEGEYFFGNRMRAYARDRGVGIADLPAVVPCPIDLRNGKQVAEFAVELRKLGAAQVWFDTLQQCSPGADENSVKDMGQVIINLKFLSRTLECLVGVVHHAGKDVSKGARGSSAWRPAVDVEFYFESGDGIAGTMTIEKLKDGPPGAVYPFKRRIVELGLRPNGQPVTSVVIEHTGDAPGQRTAKLPKPGSLARITLDAIRAAIVQCGGPVDIATARAAVVETKIEPEPGAPDRRSSRAGREIERLIAQRLLFRVDGKLSDTQVLKGADEDF